MHGYFRLGVNQVLELLEQVIFGRVLHVRVVLLLILIHCITFLGEFILGILYLSLTYHAHILRFRFVYRCLHDRFFVLIGQVQDGIA